MGNAINLNGIVLYGDTKYPWVPKPSAEGAQLESWYAQQYETANIGQLKYLFSWYINPSVTPPLPGGADSDGNGIPDWWEQYYFGKLLGNDSQTDFTGYGKTAMEHYQSGTDPTANPDVSLVIHTPLER